MMVGVTPFPAECNRHITVSHNVYNKLAGNHCRAPRQFHFFLNCPESFLFLFPYFILCFVCLIITMKTNSSNTGNASADMKPDVQHSGIRATVGNRRKSVDVIRFWAQPDDEQNRVYGDERRRRLRVEQDVVPMMNYVCKNRESDDGIDKDSQKLIYGQISVPSFSHERVEDGYGMGRSIHEDGEQFKRRSDDEEDVRSKKVTKANFTGNLNVFKRIRNSCGVETRTGEDECLFIRGLGDVEIQRGSETMQIQSVFYTPKLNRNMLSMDQLVLQGYTIKIDGEKCQIHPMFSIPVFNIKDEVTGLTKEDEIGEREKQAIISNKQKHEEFKMDFLNTYFEELHMSSSKCDWSTMIIQAIEFHDFSYCKYLLDMLEDVPFVNKYKFQLRSKFKEMVTWFVNNFLKIPSSPVLPIIRNNDQVDLMDLYLKVKRDGGYKNITSNNTWAMIAKDIGYEYHDGEFIRIMHAMYLDVLVYYYKFKTVQGRVIDKEVLEQDEGPVHEAQTVDDANKIQVNNHFELKAWICISDDFDVSVRSKEIFIAFGGEVKEEHKNFNKLQEAIRDHLTRKRFLLVLDDVWSESREDWETLVSPLYTCSPGSKIIVTARKDILLKELGYNSLYKRLESLSDDDALSLFALHALGVRNFDSHLSLKPHGEGIVKKCDGLPLALIALGTSLRTKKDEDSWKGVLQSEIWRLPVEDKIIPALRLSYHDLSAPLKRLFAYCSLFPKDFLFDKEDLVLLWMAEGFFQPTPSDSTKETLGHKFFDELLSRSFFQHAPNNESLFVMHDLMNDLASSVATEFYLRLDNESEKNIKKMKLDKYRHMSFVREECVAYEKLKVLENAKCLRTFLATFVGEVEPWQKFYLSNKILTDLLPKLPLLRVLSLSGFEISELPESIGTLRHLRYLNLSQTHITHLQEKVCNLLNLQTLILFGCDKLTELPNNFLNLKNLQRLDVRDTLLSFQMLLEISKLKSLQISLSKINIESESGTEIAKLKDFKNLYGKISVVGLEKVQNATYAHEANFSQKKLRGLELVWSDELHDSRNDMLEKAVINELKPCDDKLIQLQIRSYGGKEFPNWVRDPSFLHLKHVSIRGCKRCTSLPPLGQLPSLKKLVIEGAYGVEAVGSELFGTGQAFPSLEILSFCDMRGWKKWSGVVLPRLQKLEIKDCPNLVEVTLEALPSLNDLQLDNCDSGVLRSLVEVASAVTNLLGQLKNYTYMDVMR
ncbi:putative transcription factor & chromatin remodeling ARID family [Helianthus annuus]|nr:putative transcription factor & chromatin remodeling ARID family [Helianthus annuus]